MRTSYNGSNPNGSNDDWVNDFIEGSKESDNSTYKQISDSVSKAVLKEDLMNAYQEIEMALALKKGENATIYNEVVRESNERIKDEMYNDPLHQDTVQSMGNVNTDISDNSTDDLSKKKKSKSKAIVISLVSVLIVATVGVSIFVANKITKGNNDDNSSGVEANADSSMSEEEISERVAKIQEKINILYTDDTKVNIKDGYKVSDLDTIREELNSIPKRTDTSTLLNEVDTISKFLTSYAVVKTYSDVNYNLEPEEVQTNCDNMKLEASAYSIQGLANTLNDGVSKILSERKEYLAIKEELSSISDYIKWSSEGYSDRIKTITHTSNKTELENLLKEAIASKKNAEAKKKADEAKKKADEAKKKAEALKSEEDKKKAQKALEDAKKKQEEAEKALQETQKKLEEAQKQTTTIQISQPEPTQSQTEVSQPTVTTIPESEIPEM